MWLETVAARLALRETSRRVCQIAARYSAKPLYPDQFTSKAAVFAWIPSLVRVNPGLADSVVNGPMRVSMDPEVGLITQDELVEV